MDEPFTQILVLEFLSSCLSGRAADATISGLEQVRQDTFNNTSNAMRDVGTRPIGLKGARHFPFYSTIDHMASKDGH